LCCSLVSFLISASVDRATPACSSVEEDAAALYTFSFLMLLYFAVVSARERRASTMPSKTLTAALIADALTGTILTRVGLQGLIPLPWPQTFAVFA
jgi:hypothetical protein